MQTTRVEIGLVAALLLMLASESYAATYYVATDGAASNAFGQEDQLNKERKTEQRV